MDTTHTEARIAELKAMETRTAEQDTELASLEAGVATPAEAPAETPVEGETPAAQ